MAGVSMSDLSAMPCLVGIKQKVPGIFNIRHGRRNAGPLKQCFAHSRPVNRGGGFSGSVVLVDDQTVSAVAPPMTQGQQAALTHGWESGAIWRCL